MLLEAFATLVAATSLAGYALFRARLAPLHDQAMPRPDSGSAPRISVIIPARNEAHNLPILLASLRALDEVEPEVIVVDDHSTDGTGDVARRFGAIVVTPPPLPPGWLGKPWACLHGGRAATGESLLFTDADTEHAPRSLVDAVSALERQGADLLSVVPSHRTALLWEKLQGVFQLLLLVATRAGEATRGLGAEHGERCYAIGQYLLFRRSAYEAVGGHEAVRARVAEDLAFSRLVRERGGRYLLLATPGLVSVRMYPEGLGAFIKGWRRNFREGLKSSGGGGVIELVLVIGWLAGAPLLATIAALGDASTLALGATSLTLLNAFVVARDQRRLGELPAWGALGYPLFVALFGLVSALAAWDTLRGAPVLWRGRSVQI